MVENIKCKMQKCKLKIINYKLSIDNLAQRGVTLVELTMTLVMSAIILISIYVIVSGSHEYIIDGRKKIQLQQDFSLIEKMLSTKIRPSLHGKHEIYNNYSDYVASQPTQSSGTCLKLYFDSGDSVLLFKDNTDFKIMNTDSTFTNLVPGVLDSLIFTRKTKSVETKLSLSQGTWSLEETFVVAFRNSSSGDLGNRKCELVIQSSQVPANLTDFPLLLTEATLPLGMFNADGTNPALNGGGDIRFSSDAGGSTRLSCEIVTFTTDNNPTKGTAEIWVKVPFVSSSSDTSIWVWYDSTGATQPAASAAYGSESVWDANYMGVWHLNETVTDEATTGNHSDATSNNNDGTQDGNDDIAGKIGTAQDFDGTDDVGMGAPASLEMGTADLTVSAWVKISTTPLQESIIIAKGAAGSFDTGYHFRYDNLSGGEFRFFLGDGTRVTARSNNTLGLHDNTWHLVAAVADRSADVTFYVDGSPAGTDDISSKDGIDITDATENFAIGCYGGGCGGPLEMIGGIDEARVSTTLRSADWITAEYNNQDTPSTFVIEGTPATP